MTRNMGNPARSSARRHDGETSGVKENSVDTSTGLEGKGKLVSQVRVSDIRINVGWYEAGRTWTAAL